MGFNTVFFSPKLGAAFIEIGLTLLVTGEAASKFIRFVAYVIRFSIAIIEL